jgi:hypothetical protein
MLSIVLCLREILERSKTGFPYEITLSGIHDAMRGIRYSLEDCMRGVFLGHNIVQEPTTTIHRDMYHVIRYLMMYCEWYSNSMKNRIKLMFGGNDISKHKELVELLRLLTGIDLMNREDMGYMIVLGDRPLPTLVERYNIISLPMICAYRPRFWSAIAHEVAHTYVNGLICLSWCIDDLKNYNCFHEEIPDGFYTFTRCLKMLVGNIVRNPAMSKHIERIMHGSKRVIRWIERDIVSEILADIYAFLLSGYTYIPTVMTITAISGLKLTRSLAFSRYSPFRIFTLLSFARCFTEKYCDDLIDAYCKVFDIAEEFKDENELFNAINDTILRDLKDFIKNDKKFTKKNVLDFIDFYRKSLLDFCYKYENTLIYFKISEMAKFGENLGKKIFDFVDDNLMKVYVFNKNIDESMTMDFYGWLPLNGLLLDDLKESLKAYDDKKKNKLIKRLTKTIFSILLNLILNKVTFDRFDILTKKINSENVNIIRDELTIKSETFEIFKYIKSLEFIEDGIKHDKNKKGDGGDRGG